MAVKTATRALKSPLRIHSRAAGRTGAAPVATPPDPWVADRNGALDEYELHLRTTNNKHGRPFQEKTITAYKKPVLALNKWMTAEGMEGDFTACDTATLNVFFRWYYDTHDVPKSPDGRGGYTGGTNTLQRNMRGFFKWMAEEYDHPDPWADPKLQRYAAPKDMPPKTLSEEFIEDMLRVTGGGNPRVRDFAKLRDHAIIRVLTDVVRAEQLLNLRDDTLDLVNGLAHIVPLKEGRADGVGYVVPLQPKTVIACKRYLRARQGHRYERSGWFWLGTRGRSRLTYSGLYKMLKRRAEEAGYASAGGAHPWRHTTIHEWLDGGVSGENVMQLAGWKSSAMLRRYGADMATERAVKAVHGLGDRH
ncbi:tyrosine-type recombinase/integrase [Streptomyces luteireticuli]|uniref:Tyr recombinase domain-containing protein n=1 Tax=Streptomyces luteireticuli TaxID=173858 RepID=A0ABN0Z3E6_9ACTN